MKKKFLSVMLTICMLLTMVPLMGITAYAADEVTLHTGGGVIVDNAWHVSESDDYTYTGTASILPTPQMAGATFDGWYTNVGLTEGTKNAGESAETSVYYAKWKAVDTADNGKMMYRLRSAGGTAKGYKGGEELQAFFSNQGFLTSYSTSTIPSAGGTDSYKGTPVDNLNNDNTSELFTNLTGDVYIGRTMNLEGGLVRLTYYLQNRGESELSGLSLGAAGDSQLGGNDYVPLGVVTSGNEAYLRMYDSVAGNELRLYVKGDGVTDVNRFWYGGYQPRDNNNGMSFPSNTFNNGKDSKYKDGIDSAFSFSWSDITLTSGQTKKFSVLLGVGAPGTLESGCSLSYDLNGGVWTGGVPATRNYATGDVVTVTELVPQKSGYTFRGWNFEPVNNGTLYKSGTSNNRVAVLGDVKLYAVWGAEPCAITLTLLQDSLPYSGNKITLNMGGKVKYLLQYDEESKTYINNNIEKGDYEICVNGEYTGQWAVIRDSHYVHTLKYRKGSVTLTNDNQPWKGQSVALFKDNAKIYDLTDENDDGIYTKDNVLPNIYDIYLGGFDTGLDIDLSNPDGEAFSIDAEYMTATVNLKQDDVSLAAQNITIGEKKTQFVNDMYTADVLKGTYDVMQGTVTLGAVTTEAPTLNAEYYTVTYYDDTEVKDVKKVAKDETAEQITPSKDGYSFYKWLDDSNAEFDFAKPIIKKTNLFASWNQPIVIPGIIAKVNSTTYTCPNLKISGYNNDEMVNAVQISVDNGTVKLAAEDRTACTVQGSESKIMTIVFDESVSVADAAAVLHKINFSFTSGTQNVVFDVFAE